MDFEWDTSKERENLRKHGIAFLEAVESFSDPDGFVLVDRKHSNTEERFYWVGKTSLGKILTVRFTRRARQIRIIGAARWRNFRKLYYERTKNK